MERSFHNIIEYNGLGVSLIGFTTVLLTLLILGFIVSKMPLLVVAQEKIVDIIFNFINRRKKNYVKMPENAKYATIIYKFDIAKLNRTYRELVTALNEPFKLADLYALAREWDLEHPHLSITALREAGIIVSVPNAKYDDLFKYVIKGI